MTLFPMTILVELLINGTWVDISNFVYQRDSIQITGGSQDKQSGNTPQPATAALTLRNTDGRFSPNNASGAYYPYLKRNVQIRISVQNATSSSGNTYSGYRYWGEVTTWPPQSDISGKDVFVKITANGPLRRLSTQGGFGSALARYYAALTGSYAPIAYWPCEEDPDATQIQAGLAGGQDMDVTTGTPKFKTISDFNGSAPIGVLNNSTWDGTTGSFGSSGDDIYSVPGTYTWFASTTTADVRAWAPGGGGQNGHNRNAGGGGEYARESALALTVGNAYTITIQPGGAGGLLSNSGANKDGSDAASQTFAGDAVTVTAHGGKGGTSSGVGAGGTGSSNGTHHDGGAGGTGTTGGGGGGSSGGTAAAGNAGSNASGNTGGAGGTAPTGGGAGGRGGDAPNDDNGTGGVSPGGGGGAGAKNTSSGAAHSGNSGAPGRVELIYTPQTQPSTNVMRFIMLVPKHGGNPGKVLVRFLTSSSVLARLDVTYAAGGKLRLQGYNGSSVQQFDSTAQSWGIDNKTIMVSVELSNSGANVAWAFKAIQPGNSTLLGSTSGTVNTAAVGNVSEVTAGPNADITKTAIGHISVQYALVDLRKVSRALHGHHGEIGIHRFIRLLNEEAMGSEPGYNETNDHWGFESGTQSWVATSGALTNPTTTFTPALDYNYVTVPAGGTWPTEGTHSLLLTCNGGANPHATSPTGTSGLNVLVGDRVSVAGHFYTPAACTGMYIGIHWYKSDGTSVSEDDAADYASSVGEIFTMTHHAIAPATAAFFCVVLGSHTALANNTLIYADDITVHPKFGPQTRKQVHDFLKELKKLDQGILRESRKLWGLGYRTRINLVNQAAALTLDYSQAMLSDPLQPVLDEHNVKNDVTVHRHKGSKVRVTLESGTMSVQEPPSGTGRHRHHVTVVAHADEQLLALANQILTLGTVSDERYPTINVDLARCGIPSHPLAPLMSACAGIECGDYISLTNLANWYPSTTAKQLVIGYTETLSTFQWQISWNCVAESPWEITLTNLRRW